MNDSLGIRNARAANRAEFSGRMRVTTMQDSLRRIWAGFVCSEDSRRRLDADAAFSGDDLARIAAFEPYREPSLWADVRGAA